MPNSRFRLTSVLVSRYLNVSIFWSDHVCTWSSPHSGTRQQCCRRSETWRSLLGELCGGTDRPRMLDEIGNKAEVLVRSSASQCSLGHHEKVWGQGFHQSAVPFRATPCPGMLLWASRSRHYLRYCACSAVSNPMMDAALSDFPFFCVSPESEYSSSTANADTS